MLNQTAYSLGANRSCIRDLFEYGRARAAVVGEENVFDYSLGNPSIPSPAAVDEAVRQILQDTPTLQIHGYTSAVGDAATRQAIADDLNRRYDAGCRGENFFLGCGAAPELVAVFTALAVPEGELLAIAPYFPEYKPFAQAAGLNFRVVPPDVPEFQIKLDAVAAMLTPHTQAVLINTPNNPSGVVYTQKTLEALGALLTQKSREYGHPIYLISDEPYRELAYGVEVPFVPLIYPNTVVCYSYSKSLSLPGERIGYLAVNPKAEQAMTIAEVCPQISRTIGCNGTSTLMQLTVGRCADLTSQLEIYERNKDRLFSALTECGFSCVEPGGSFYMFPRSLEPDDVAFCKRATELDLFLVPGTAFGCPGHFRLAYCVPEERVVAALPRFRQLAERYQRQKG